MFQLTTPRLLLRQWHDADYVPFAKLNGDSEVMEFFPEALNRKQSDVVLNALKSDITDNGWGFWAVETLSNKELIGFTGIQQCSDTPRGSAIEIGWRLVRNSWGKGYATEAARASLLFAFDVLNLAEVISFTAVANARSQAVMQRLGMTKRDPNFMHPKVSADSALCEHVLYSIYPKEFAADLTVEVERV